MLVMLVVVSTMTMVMVLILANDADVDVVGEDDAVPLCRSPHITVDIDDLSPGNVELQPMRCALHWLSVRTWCDACPPTILSWSFDKSPVHSYRVLGGAFAVPSGEAWYGVPQEPRYRCVHV